MNDACLFHSTVPVMQRYVTQSTVIAGKISYDSAFVLDQRLTEDGFSCGEHIWIAQNFAMRGVFPVRNLRAPDLQEGFSRPTELITHGEAVLSYLDSLTVKDFDGCAARSVSHRAGHADLVQSGADYLLHFIVPNMLFHLVTGYAILRQSGLDIGKADFDGLHAYAKGFRFT